MPTGATESGSKAGISKHGLFVILASTAIALLGTPLASPAMPEIARVFAENAQNELFARAILQAISVLPGDPSVSGASGYFADSFYFMFVGRAILGLSIAGIKTATVAMVGDYYQGAERDKIVGWQGSAMKIGGVIFMLLGGFMANYSWQARADGFDWRSARHRCVQRQRNR